MKPISIAKRSTLKLAKLQNLVAKRCKMRKLQPCKICKFCIFWYYVRENTFDGKIIKTFARNICAPVL